MMGRLIGLSAAQAVAIPHYAVIANVIQMAAHHKVNVQYTTWDKQRFRPGDVAVAGKFQFFVIKYLSY